jgi:hypothetical protein
MYKIEAGKKIDDMVMRQGLNVSRPRHLLGAPGRPVGARH